MNLKLGQKVRWVMLITSIHLKIAGFSIKVLNAGDPNVMTKVRSTLHKPEIAHLEPETFMQGTFNRDEQFRSHKDATLHYEDFEWQRPNCMDRKIHKMYRPRPPILAITNMKLGQEVLSATLINLVYKRAHASLKILVIQVPLCFYICCKRNAIW
ncbi:predicted protein [Lichtheimia corymbifera JMRC:FSU:9682]|uniref:Uncharacterized protein n=1 Tax=Lichtheimia corymbifera JMRC:FSU:9682 TaxID=1263082 RepID=A0A068S6S4_9FUNG|nr:predicted protein [Lichtheimia corymbifera JMRC:FSU:9682]